MEKVVVDTDILIDFLRMGEGKWLELVRLGKNGKIEMYCSSVTVMELFAGKSAEIQEELLVEMVNELHVVPFDGRLARQAGEVKRELRSVVSLANFMIGMTAVSVGAKLATKNRKHFEGISGLKFFRI